MQRRYRCAHRPAVLPRRPALEQLERRDLLSIGLNFFQVPAQGREGEVLALSARASDPSGAPLTYRWTFGDGATASGVDLTDPTHAFAAPATPGTPWTVSLTVSNGTDSVSDSAPVITDAPPTVDLGTSQTVHAGDVVAFHAAVADPGGASDIASVRWDFRYDGVTFSPDASADNNLTPTRIYTTPGTYLVAVQATDQGGNATLGTTAVVVEAADALQVDAGPDRAVTVGEAVALSGSYSDPGEDVSADGIAWDTNYDGRTFHPVLTGSLTPTTTFNTPGTCEVALRVTDANGDSDLDVRRVVVSGPSYTGPAVVAGNDQAVHVGDTVSFNGSYTDLDGLVNLADVAWDFHYDGGAFTPETTGTLTPTQTYAAPGQYLVALQVTDSHGLTGVDTLRVTVNFAAFPVNAGADQTVNVGDVATFSGSFSDPGNANGLDAVAWDFHYDGSNFNPTQTGTLTAQHVFTTAGTYTVALRVTTPAGDSSLDTLTVTVDPRATLVVDAGPAQAASEGDTVSFAASVSDPSAVTAVYWSFNYSGYSVNFDPGAATLTPTHTFTTPGSYEVAVWVYDMAGIPHVGITYVDVADVSPNVAAGAVGPVYSTMVDGVDAQVLVENSGTGEILVNWTGGSATQVDPGAAFGIAGTAPGLNIALLTAGADYQLTTNGSIEQASAASGVQGFSLSVDTTVYPDGSAAVGDGYIGAITLPANSTVGVHARGDLGSIVGPSTGSADTGTLALDLVFANLDGSITGLDHIDQLLASGSLGQDATQQVAVNAGIDV